jgi:hypothetical protein
MAILFHLAFWHMDLGYFGRGSLGSWPQADAGVVLWSLSVCANDWQSAEKLTRLYTIPEPAMFSEMWDKDALRDEGQNPPTAALAEAMKSLTLAPCPPVFPELRKSVLKPKGRFRLKPSTLRHRLD